MLLLWVGLLVAVLAWQYLTADSIDTRHGMPLESTGLPDEELEWYCMPPLRIVLISILLFIALRWLIPEKGTRTIVRVWGSFAAVATILWSFGVSIWYYWKFLIRQL